LVTLVTALVNAARRCRARSARPVVCRLLVAVAFASASAFSPAQPTPASTYLEPPQVPNPSLVPSAPRLPAPALAPPPATQDPALSPPAPARPTRGERVVDFVLVLPLESAAFARAAEAVRDGFVGAAEATGAKGRVRVIAHGDRDVLDAFAEAEALGPRVIVGPLSRDDLRAVASSARAPGLTLALNQLDEGVAPVPDLYTITLAVESDARVLARRMRADNVNTVAVIRGSAPLAERLATAFAAEWLLAGGGAPETFSFETSPERLGALRRDLARSTAEAALIAVDGPSAALARTFAPRIPAYASSLINVELDPSALADLEGVVFVDMPWIVTPGEAALAKLPRRAMGSRVLDRLYAFGLDAFLVARALASGVPGRLELAGATGRLTLSEGRAILREGTLAKFQRGQIVPADGR
jgi:outer membrane PBP1 activator LpoA protein